MGFGGGVCGVSIGCVYVGCVFVWGVAMGFGGGV